MMYVTRSITNHFCRLLLTQFRLLFKLSLKILSVKEHWKVIEDKIDQQTVHAQGKLKVF
jgi:hypothetical protein